MTQVIRVCKYGCKQQLSDFDKKENKYREVNGTLHTRERCESLKQNSVPNSGNDLSVEVLVEKLESLGITIDVNKLRNVK